MLLLMKLIKILDSVKTLLLEKYIYTQKKELCNMIFSELKIQNGEIIGYSAKLAFELLLSRYDLVPDTEKTTLKSNFTHSGTPYQSKMEHHD